MRIELRQVTVEKDGRMILQGIDGVFMPGRVTVILGRSGAGVSALLKTAAGLLDPASGQVLYDDCHLAALSAKQRRGLQTRTGFMFQDAALWANQTLAANLDLPLRAKDRTLPEADRRAKIESAMRAFGWAVDLSLRPAQLSLGEQKVLSFLRAVIPGPEALFLDEPFASLDGYWCSRLVQELADLRAQGVTVAVVSMDPDLIAELADDVVIMSAGRVLVHGTLEQIERSLDPEVQSVLCECYRRRRPVALNKSEEPFP